MKYVSRKFIIDIIILSLVILLGILTFYKFARSQSATGAYYENTVTYNSNLSVRVVPTPTVTVCIGYTASVPCNSALSLAAIFTEPTLTTIKSNPFTGDVNGNINFWVASGYTYTVTISGSNVGTYDSYFAPLSGSGTGTITGVMPGTGMTGGGSSGSVTVGVNPSLVPLMANNNTFTSTNTFAKALFNGIVPWVSPQAYGVTGNGSTDDTNALQLAINAAEIPGTGSSSCIVLEPGDVIMLTHPIYLNASVPCFYGSSYTLAALGHSHGTQFGTDVIVATGLNTFQNPITSISETSTNVDTVCWSGTTPSGLSAGWAGTVTGVTNGGTLATSGTPKITTAFDGAHTLQTVTSNCATFNNLYSGIGTGTATPGTLFGPMISWAAINVFTTSATGGSTSIAPKIGGFQIIDETGPSASNGQYGGALGAPIATISRLSNVITATCVDPSPPTTTCLSLSGIGNNTYGALVAGVNNTVGLNGTWVLTSYSYNSGTNTATYTLTSSGSNGSGSGLGLISASDSHQLAAGIALSGVVGGQLDSIGVYGVGNGAAVQFVGDGSQQGNSTGEYPQYFKMTKVSSKATKYYFQAAGDFSGIEIDGGGLEGDGTGLPGSIAFDMGYTTPGASSGENYISPSAALQMNNFQYCGKVIRTNSSIFGAKCEEAGTFLKKIYANDLPSYGWIIDGDGNAGGCCDVGTTTGASVIKVNSTLEGFSGTGVVLGQYSTPSSIVLDVKTTKLPSSPASVSISNVSSDGTNATITMSSAAFNGYMAVGQGVFLSGLTGAAAPLNNTLLTQSTPYTQYFINEVDSSTVFKVPYTGSAISSGSYSGTATLLAPATYSTYLATGAPTIPWNYGSTLNSGPYNVPTWNVNGQMVQLSSNPGTTAVWNNYGPSTLNSSTLTNQPLLGESNISSSGNSIVVFGKLWQDSDITCSTYGTVALSVTYASPITTRTTATTTLTFTATAGGNSPLSFSYPLEVVNTRQVTFTATYTAGTGCSGSGSTYAVQATEMTIR